MRLNTAIICLAIFISAGIRGALFDGAIAAERIPAERIPAERPPSRFDTKYAAVYYTDEEDLLSFGRKIGGGLSFMMRNKEKARSGIRDDVDKIINRVSDILDMHPDKLYFSVNIYKTYVEITVVYREFSPSGKSPIAFYAHRAKTIYVNLDRLNDGIFAHEAAHAVICLYFGTPPPSKMQEILAQHVDRHLWDE